MISNTPDDNRLTPQMLRTRIRKEYGFQLSEVLALEQDDSPLLNTPIIGSLSKDHWVFHFNDIKDSCQLPGLTYASLLKSFIRHGAFCVKINALGLSADLSNAIDSVRQAPWKSSVEAADVLVIVPSLIASDYDVQALGRTVYSRLRDRGITIVVGDLSNAPPAYSFLEDLINETANRPDPRL